MEPADSQRSGLPSTVLAIWWESAGVYCLATPGAATLPHVVVSLHSRHSALGFSLGTVTVIPPQLHWPVMVDMARGSNGQ
jgi:hypothetical protein